MTDTHNTPTAITQGGESANAEIMDQALEWLVLLESPTPEQTRQFNDWLNVSPLHAEAFHRAQAIWGSPQVAQCARQLNAPAAPSTLPRRRARRWRMLATAAVLVLGVFSFSDLPLRLQADHLTAVGQQQRLHLEDGSSVLLNTNSAFSSTIDAQQRIARLHQGEAFFEISDSRDRPLELDVGPVRASVRDTAFAVRYQDGVAHVGVQRGDVDLQAAHSGAWVRISAGQSIHVGPNGFKQPTLLDHKDLAWTQGRLVFENSPMSEVLAELRRYYPGWIINTNARLADVAVTGNYRLDQPLEVVRSLAHITSARLQEFPALIVLN
ncbi:FecR domain-containing protein [Pseudomonas sp. MYb185]|uniref:FecR family protein n=1 Tax=Pseudomonas sp. MYb185 TaxID=1848729 RepID=UPI000CFDBD90|nr:FecR domain-containing protein [Pseudomonas sp. MYb185]PRB84461.1 glycerol-3-phosphate ABC transporter substrate-binding protein [Pseudomonas sp. MYb185]